jgi:hypothetical protein
MAIIKTLKMGDIAYNAITYNWLYFYVTLLMTVNNKQICNVSFFYVICKVIISKVSVSIVIMCVFATSFANVNYPHGQVKTI